jgi:hypothetical protein
VQIFCDDRNLIDFAGLIATRPPELLAGG